MTRLKVAVRWTAGLTAVFLAASACGGGGNDKAGDGTFTVGHPEPDHLVPGNTTSSYSFEVIAGLFDNLVGLDKTGQTFNQAAESVESKDQKTWTIKVKAGQKFHNGESVTAASFADAWNYAAYGPNAFEANDYFAQIAGYADLNPEDEKAKPKGEKLSGLKVIDDSTLEVTLSAPFSQFPQLLTYPAYAPLPKAAFTDLKAFENHPIGNGPYMMSGDWERNRQVKLVPFSGYTGPRKPKNKGVTWKSYSSADTTYTDLRAGRIDVMQTIPAAKAPEAKRLLGDRFLVRQTGTFDYLGFPLFDKRFDNADLRKAFSMAIDRKGVINAVYNGTYTAADSLLPPMIKGHRPGACGEVCTYNPTKAKELFDKVGGFKGTLELYFSNAQPSYEQWMQIVANGFKKDLGITDIQFRKIPVSDYLTMLSDKKEKGPYRQNWEADYPSAQNYLEPQWGPDNRMSWKGAAADEFMTLIGKANAAGTEAESLKLYNQAEDVALREMPLVPLWIWQGQGGRSEKVDNVTITPFATGLLAHEVTVK
ncbi:ABC transporter substrate-binding protein [Actinomadura sp. HBU206391]|uniref:peptide ABC transporter substrate-binding protein n=1 Tax=Actinomadura sp. HBU206391 TaxID=2731692 RepID=UPI001650D28C|nr:ABC transporter substrate-binding protein [Actinomadura sp. HBU206391]MBC6460091.1 ABC transporter substrate-binding protein [Actinomadura sp. HBU206391]